MNSLNNNVSGIFISGVISLLSKDLLFKAYFSSLQLVISTCDAALKFSPYILLSGHLGTMSSFWVV